MNARICFIAAAMALVAGSAHADVVLCTGADGKKVFQETPCATGTQKTLDDSTTRARQKIEAQKREEKAELQSDARLLRSCVEDKICESDTYPRLLRGKSRAFVNENLGDPASVQNIGGSEIHYFSVPTTDGRKRAKLQLSYKNFAVESVNVY